jgi:ABC-type branched-subunit amino acid transport system permease subunit
LTSAVAQPADLRPPAWSFPLRLFGPIVAGIALALFMQYVMLPAAKGYGTLVVFAGINIILGVSLTIVNGFTGQFSIGHAGFMALGAYAASAIVYYGSYKLYGDANFHGGRLSFVGGDPGSGRLLDSGDLLFVGACLFAGIIAAIAGWIVGLPSLRLRGDYLAIVTLGFGEIVRVVLQGTDAQLMSVADVASVHWWQLPNKLGGRAWLHLPADLRNGVLDLRLGRDHAHGRDPPEVFQLRPRPAQHPRRRNRRAGGRREHH